MGWGSRAPAPAPGPATSAPSGSGWGSRANTGSATPSAPPKKGGGGFWGAVAHLADATGVGAVAHETSKLGTGLANDLTGFLPGVYQLGTTEAQALSDDLHARNNAVNNREWADLFTGHLGRMFHEASKGDASPAAQRLAATEAQMGLSAAKSLSNPHYIAQHPDQTLLNVLALASGGATVAARAGGVGSALKAGELGQAVRAASRTPVPAPRLVKVGELKVPLTPSNNPLVRSVQAVHDRVIQNAIDTNPEGRVAAYGTKRLGGALDEARRPQEAMQAGPAHLLQRTGKGLSKVEQVALRLTSNNETVDNARLFHVRQIADGVGEKADHLAQIKLLNQVAKQGLLVDENGRMVVDAAKFPKLASVDQQLHEGAMQRDRIAVRTGQISAEGARARIDAPNRIRAGGEYVAPTAARLGKPSRALLQQRTEVARLERVFEKSQVRDNTASSLAAQRAAGKRNIVAGDLLPAYLGGRGVSPITERLGGALSVARDRLTKMEEDAARRAEPTGIVGGDGARPGRNYTPEFSSEPKPQRSQVGRTPQPVVGGQRNLIAKTQHYKGENLAVGKLPDSTTAVVARQMQRASRYLNTDQFRRMVAKAGSTTRQTSRDVLVNTQELKNAKVPPDTQVQLGNRLSTLEETQGHRSAFEALRQKILPGLNSASDEAVQEATALPGVAAPKGFVWVDRNLLGDLGRPLRVGSKSKVGEAVDTVNSAITAATVYYKIGHTATRVFTDLGTNIIQGSASPVEMGKSFRLWRDLSRKDQMRALAAAGQGGIQALPSEAENVVGKVARVGAAGWSRFVDARFRFNSLAYEARRNGITSPAAFARFLNDLEKPDRLTPERRAQVQTIANRANREAIAYDRLTAAEKNVVRRAIWFYPWIKGATVFAKDTLLEHPAKSALIGAVGGQGKRQQFLDLGVQPSYNNSVFKVGGSADLPLTANAATLSPFSTPADVLGSLLHVGHPTQAEQLSNYASPMLGAAGELAYHLDPFGGASKGDTAANFIASLLAPTPESSLGTIFGGGTKGKMFPANRNSLLLKYLFGSEYPRVMDRAVANRAAGLEKKNAGRK
jgi:hypothetical protein